LRIVPVGLLGHIVIKLPQLAQSLRFLPAAKPNQVGESGAWNVELAQSEKKKDHDAGVGGHDRLDFPGPTLRAICKVSNSHASAVAAIRAAAGATAGARAFFGLSHICKQWHAPASDNAK
jgi:hypothetical protein